MCLLCMNKQEWCQTIDKVTIFLRARFCACKRNNWLCTGIYKLKKSFKFCSGDKERIRCISVWNDKDICALNNCFHPFLASCFARVVWNLGVRCACATLFCVSIFRGNKVVERKLWKKFVGKWGEHKLPAESKPGELGGNMASHRVQFNNS